MAILSVPGGLRDHLVLVRVLGQTVKDCVQHHHKTDDQLDDEAVVREPEVFVDDAGEDWAGEVTEGEEGREEARDDGLDLDTLREPRSHRGSLGTPEGGHQDGGTAETLGGLSNKLIY